MNIELFIFGMSIGNLVALCALGFMVQSMWASDGRLQDRLVESILELRSRLKVLEDQDADTEAE